MLRWVGDGTLPTYVFTVAGQEYRRDESVLQNCATLSAELCRESSTPGQPIGKRCQGRMT